MGFKHFHKFLIDSSNKVFFTLSKKAKFSIRIDDDYIYFTPHCSGLERKSRISTISTVYDLNRESGSYNTSKYIDITVNSSYMLSLINVFYYGGVAKQTYQDISDYRAVEGYQLDTIILKKSRNQLLAKKQSLETIISVELVVIEKK